MQEAPLLTCEREIANKGGFWTNLKETVHQVVEELMAPPTVSAVCSCQNQLHHFHHIKLISMLIAHIGSVN